mmetsp:Transcript_93404/g.166158  ORF Transcript_93404/g.166158 Transcript_93404/m.166158 type:complete len:260 (-) Transcript_93404:32-811(-)
MWDEMELDPFALEHHGSQPEAAVQLAQLGQESFLFGVQALLLLAIDGYPRAIRSTRARRNELLRLYNGNARSSVEAAVDSQDDFLTEARDFLIQLVPSVGMPVSILYPLWKNLRMLLLVAGLFGHNLEGEEVKTHVICASVGLQSVPKAENTIEKALEVLWRRLAGSIAKLVPASHIILQVLDLESRAITSFIDHFSDGPGVSETEYLQELDPDVGLKEFLELLREIGAQSLEQLRKALEMQHRGPHWESSDGRIRPEL